MKGQFAYKCNGCGAFINIILPLGGREVCPGCYSTNFVALQNNIISGIPIQKCRKNGSGKKCSKRRKRDIQAHGNQNSLKPVYGVRLKLKPVRKQLKK